MPCCWMIPETRALETLHLAPRTWMRICCPSQTDLGTVRLPKGELPEVKQVYRSRGESRPECCFGGHDLNGNPLQYSCLENSMDREAWGRRVGHY